jgi:hypothetical protein
MSNQNELGRIARNVARKRGERCKHFNGIQNKTCREGVCYESFPYKVMQLPCLPDMVKPDFPVGQCANYAVYTPEELAEQERVLKEHLEQMDKVLVSIKPFRDQVKKTKQSYSGRLDCAACGGKNTLGISISSYNGHAHGKCSACDVAWIE